MARKNGCPMSVRDWQIDVLSRASTKANPTWIRIKGISSLTFTIDSETEDGSTAADLWSEDYTTKRSATLNLEGRPIVDPVSGTQDPGQAELDYLATQGGCDGDGVIRLTDAYGHSRILDIIVTSTDNGADETSNTRSWDTTVVGEPEEVAYIQATGVATTPASTASVAVGETEAVTVAFTPANASNQKYYVASADTTKVKVTEVDGLNFNIVGVSATATNSPVNVTVRTMNNNLTATIAVTVTA